MKDGSEAVAETDGVMDLICVKPATALVDLNFEDTFYRRVVLNVLSNGQNAAIWLPGSFLKKSPACRPKHIGNPMGAVVAVQASGRHPSPAGSAWRGSFHANVLAK